MKISINKVQVYILLLYVFFNTYGLFYVFLNKETFGDFVLPLKSDYFLLLAYLSVVIPFVFFNLWLFPYFQNRMRMSIPRLSTENKMSMFVLILQVMFIVFNLIEGVNSAGSNLTTSSPIKYVFIMFAPDMFFLILYGFARNNKFFKYNLIVYLISNLQRGWLGGLLTVLIIEFFVFYKKYGFSRKLIFTVSSLGALVIFISPYLVALKWAVRGYFGGISSDANAEFDLIFSLGNKEYLTSLGETLNYIMARFQVLSNTYLMFEYSNVIYSAADKGEFVSFYLVGLPQRLIIKLFGFDYQMLNSFIASIFDSNYYINNSTYNTHTGWFGWVISEPYLVIQYFIYSVSLIWIVVYLSSKIGGEYIYIVSWVMTLMLFMQGWIDAYISLLIALVAFLFVKSCLDIRIPRRT
ncbi:oligosaccharide repeat unit polymerase [Vibrio aestuarianus]|uniref:oligosaccharide repeat unit polymerase n=1 Tax=Vibrio aestuarianus TaxID=28171 RepID=UPI00237D05E7|nr:oligosaccharide repeat unit polymerase [Vibrio aestuarianus]